MKSVQLVHNPGAGAEAYNGEKLTALLNKNGYDCGYLSTKDENWKEDLNTDVDLLIVAGGDGTIRKVVKQVLKTRLLDRPAQIAVLPMGTANNIAKALNAKEEVEKTISSWSKDNTKGFDVGRVWNVPDHKFFLESFGYGVFPFLMREMEKIDDSEFKTPEESLHKAWEVLHKIILSYEPRQCHLEIDGKTHSGKYLLAEIMNTPSIGPNLFINPSSDPGDGAAEVVLVGEHHKEKFAKYVERKLQGKVEEFTFKTLKGTDIKISWEGTHVHIDDQIVKLKKGEEVTVQLRKGLLNFLVP